MSGQKKNDTNGTMASCEVCHDAGWLVDASPTVGFTVIECPACHLPMRRRLAQDDERFGYTEHLRHHDLSQWEQTEDTTLAYLAARNYIELAQGWLVLWGPRGTGKTMLLSCIVNGLRAKGIEAVYAVVPDMLDMLRRSYNVDERGNEGWSFGPLMERLETVPVLVLDDLAVEKPTEWAQEKLYQIIDARYRARVLLLVATNVAPTKLGLAGGRIASRLQDKRISVVVKCGVADYRIKSQQ